MNAENLDKTVIIMQQYDRVVTIEESRSDHNIEEMVDIIAGALVSLGYAPGLVNTHFNPKPQLISDENEKPS